METPQHIDMSKLAQFLAAHDAKQLAEMQALRQHRDDLRCHFERLRQWIRSLKPDLRRANNHWTRRGKAVVNLLLIAVSLVVAGCASQRSAGRGQKSVPLPPVATIPVALGWNASPGAMSYNVWLVGNFTGKQQLTKLMNVATNQFIGSFQGQLNTLYGVTVTAVGAYGESGYATIK